MSSAIVRDESFGDERAIRALSGRAGVSLAEVRALFSTEFARLELGAKVHSYLSALTAANVRALLRHAGSAPSWVLLAIAALAPSVPYAQGRTGGIPEHATARTYGTGWECNPGYQRLSGVSEVCTAVELPAGAYLSPNAYGRGWDCARGYRAEGKACVAIELPPHAYLDSSGSRWKCDRGYQSLAARCALVVVPPHANLTAAGDGWECDRGYVSVDAACVRVAVPANAHLDYSGSEWDCDQPYRRERDSCVLR